MERYAIPEENMERLKKKLATIKKKCSQYGCEFVFNEVGEEFREVLTEDGMKQTIRFILVEAEGCAVVNGWQFGLQRLSIPIRGISSRALQMLKFLTAIIMLHRAVNTAALPDSAKIPILCGILNPASLSRLGKAA